MKKKIFLFCVLAIMFAGSAFAQSHWVSLEVKAGAGLRYEYVITPSFTVGGYFSYSYFTIPTFFGSQKNSIEFGATARWYPSAGKFFVELNVGYNIFEYYTDFWYSNGGDSWNYWWGWEGASGFCIAPGLGWTIDLGQMGAFFLAPGVKVPITVSGIFSITISPYIGLGYAF